MTVLGRHLNRHPTPQVIDKTPNFVLSRVHKHLDNIILVGVGGGGMRFEMVD